MNKELAIEDFYNNYNWHTGSFDLPPIIVPVAMLHQHAEVVK